MKLPAVQEVLDYITDHLAPKDLERHKYGEVFTPLTLVDEMLATLPKDVWGKKDWKWLDPANGIGNFPIKALLGQTEGAHTYPGLMHGLEKEIPDAGRRCKHIVENMLFMVDINPKNNAIARRLFEKLCPGARANIDQIDRKDGFLSAKPLVFNGKEVAGFDVIMGNPPYQGGAIRSKTTNATRKMREEHDLGQSKHVNLWIPFVDKSLELLREEGHLLFIHPVGWFRPEKTGIHDRMLKYQFDKIRIYDMYQAQRAFHGAGKISIAYYRLDKKRVSRSTTIIDRLQNIENIRLNDKSILILAMNSIFLKIQKKCKLFIETNNLRTSALSNKNCKSGKNKQIYRIREDGTINVVMTAAEHKDQNVQKLIITGYKNPRFFFDKKGEYGVIGSHHNYFIGDNLEKIEDYFKTKLSAALLTHAKFDQEYIEPRFYPDVRTLDIEKITENGLANYFEFNDAEKTLIADTAYPTREYKIKEIFCKELSGSEKIDGGYRHKTRKLRR